MPYFIAYSEKSSCGKNSDGILHLNKEINAVGAFDKFVKDEQLVCKESGTEFFGASLICLERGLLKTVKHSGPCNYRVMWSRPHYCGKQYFAGEFVAVNDEEAQEKFSDQFKKSHVHIGNKLELFCITSPETMRLVETRPES